MATGRRRHEGELHAWHVCMMLARMPFTGVALNPLEVNPYATEKVEKSKAMAELEAWQARKKWAVIHTPPTKR